MTPRHDPFLRSAGGILLGFVVLASIGAVLGPMAINAAFKPDQLLQPGWFAPTPLAMVLQLSLLLVATLLAGYLCRLVAISRRPAVALAAVIFVLSLFPALFAVTVPNDAPAPRRGDETPETVRSEMTSQQPKWLALVQPPLLLAGILLGNRRRRRSPPAQFSSRPQPVQQ